MGKLVKGGFQKGKFMPTRKKMIYKFIVGFTVLYTAICIADDPLLGITKDDILNVLLDQQDRIEDLSFSFNMERVTKNKETLQVVEIKRDKISLCTKGELFKTRRQSFENRPEGEPPVWDQEWSADGKMVYLLNAPSMFGTVETKLPSIAPIRQNWAERYLTACRRTSLRKPGNRAYGSNLIGELEETSGLTLLDKMDVFNGRKTVVLEYPSFKPSLMRRIYLDPQIGFAVVGFEAEDLELVQVNSRFKEVMEGLWFPMRVEKRRLRGTNIIETKIEVSDLQVNRGLTAADFKIQFPPGTRIFDRNLNAYLPPTQHGISDDYLDEVLNIALDRNMIDVYHVSKVRNQQVTNSLEDETTQTVEEKTKRIEEKGPNIIAETEGGWRWQAIVTVCALLALTVPLLLLYYSRHCLNRARRREK